MYSNQRVPLGGLYHAHKNKYSKETHDLLRVMMDECKLSYLQKKQLDYSIRNGDSLPLASQTGKTAVPSRQKIEIKPTSFQRRSLESIQKMGAYDREKFVPAHPRVDKELEKSKLQSIMAFGKEIPQTPVGKRIWKRKSAEIPQDHDRFDELIEEVIDRKQFLNEMEEYGQGKKYQQLIKTEIEIKLKEMQELDMDRYNEISQSNNFLK
ncbi:hypothetical protein J437_LFUL013083 [Ladona fulva]|uniref:Uncharacterized protein n=1 Tax=Ladona fulva TaxID=123851 RepID=A0A8K0KIT0_LADFU|nr:hypothetical protein J437_LFUL013083 [Ladona fulva]